MIIELDDNYIDKLNDAFGYILGDIKKNINDNPFSKYLIYLENEKVVGYINYYLIYDRIEIASFNVLDVFQNNGIGSKLLENLINSFDKKVKNITLEVKKDNEKAIYLYHKYGFKDMAIRKGYYDGVDGILMEKEMM